MIADRVAPPVPLSFAEVGKCIAHVASAFPFEGYIEARRHAYRSIAANCTRLLAPGARILDFGAGPCDTTAVLSRMGFFCTAIDDLEDEWHALGDNRARIRSFAENAGVDLIVSNRLPPTLAREPFDMIMLHDVIEHFADSPRDLLLRLTSLLKSGGYLYISVPNAVNLRKRLLVLSGRTNYPRFPAYYWSGPTWRGHKREYVKDDLEQLCAYLGLDRVLLRGEHHRLDALPRWSQGLYRMTVGRIDSLRETLSLIGQKSADWRPTEISAEAFRQIRLKETPYRLSSVITTLTRLRANLVGVLNEVHREVSARYYYYYGHYSKYMGGKRVRSLR
jgi:SAM-dependent methyltransferase